jgi:ATP-dependent protease ClpP protease subunit
MTTKKHDDRELFLEWGIHFPTRTIELMSDIDESSARIVVMGLHMLEAENKQPITILMKSPGGDDYSGYSMYSAIRNCESETTIEVYGQIMSMAVFVLQAADRRICMDPFARFMVHESQHAQTDTHRTELKAYGKETDVLDAVYEEVLLTRIREKNPKFTAQKLNDMVRNYEYFDVKTALKLGLIDEVV